MARLAFEAVPHAWDGNGNPVSGAQMFIYEAGTTTPVVTYSDAALTTPQTQPLIANAAGFFEQVYVTGTAKYRARVADDEGTLLYEADNIAQDTFFNFDDRNQFEQSTVASDVPMVTAGGILYLRDANGLLSSADGATWSPVGQATLQVFDAVGDGVADDTAALATALTRAIQADSSKQYAYTGQITISGNISGTLRLKLNASMSGNTPSVIVTGAVERLEIEVATGVTVDRAISVQNGAHIKSLKVVSIDQQANRSDTLDGAVYVSGNYPVCEQIEVENFDNAIVAYDSIGPRFGAVHVKSYVRGWFCRECTYVSRLHYQCQTTSPNGTTDPGHNGTLYEEVTDSFFGNETIMDAGEHGHRIGGDVGGTGCQNLSFGVITCIRSGQCAVKLNDSSQSTRNISYETIFSVDAAFLGAQSANKEIFRCEKAIDVRVGMVTGARQVKGFAAYGMIYIAGCSRVYVDGTTCDGTAGPLVFITDVVSLDGSPATIPCSDVKIADLNGSSVGGDAVEISSTTEDLGHIVVNRGYLRDVTGNVVSITTNDGTGTGGIPNPIVIDLDYHNAAAGLNTTSTSTRIYATLTERA